MYNHKSHAKPIISSLVLLVLVILAISPASAFSAGANLAGAGTDGGGGWSGTWNNTGRITADDGSYSTTNSFHGGANSHTLTATGFGFNIDTNATITGISVSIDRYASGSNVRDYVVQLVKAGAPDGTNNAITGSSWPTTPGGVQSYTPTSPANPLWGTTWTPAQINATNFGMVLQVRNIGGGGTTRTASVDYISITVSYTIPPTLSVINSPVTYNGSPQAATVTASVAGSAVSDIKYNGSSTVPTNAGTYAITADFTPSDTSNYSTLNDASAGNFIINKATPTLSVTNSPVTYNGLAQAATVSGSVTGSVTNIKYDGSSTTPTNAKTYAVTADFAPTDATNYNSLTGTTAGNFNISKRAVTVTANAKSKTYGDADSALTYQITSGSLVGSDAFTGALSRVAGETVASSPYAIQQNTLALSGNYILTYIGANFTITTRPVTVTADAKSRTYGDTDPALTYQITSGSLAFSDTFSGALSRVAGETVASSPYAIQQNTLALSSNYNLTYIGANFSITTRPVTVTADAQNKTYGDTDPSLSYQITFGSLAFSDAFSGDLTRDTGEDVGSYAINQNTLALSANYDLTYVGDDLTITTRPITVTADAQNKTYGDTDPSLSYQITSGSLAFSDAFSGALSRVAGETVASSPYAIQQNTLAVSSNYDLTYVGDDLTITARPITVAADAKSKVYGETDPVLTYQITSGSLVGSDAFTGTLTRIVDEAVGPYAILQNDLALPANYDLNYVGDNLTIITRPITVTADAQNKTYGDADPALTYQITSGSLVGSDTFSGELSRVVGEAVGPYAILQNNLALPANYDLTYVGADLAITTRLITVTADAQNKTYGDADPALTYQITFGSLAFSDAFSGDLTRDAGEDVGDYNINQGTLELSSNYDLTYIGDDLAITTRLITVTADIQNKTYGDTDPALTYQITFGSLAFSDDFSGGLSRVTGQNVSSYAIQQNDLMLSANYDLTYIGANFTITTRPITVTADAKSKAYGETDPALTYQITSGSLAFSDAFSGVLSRVTGEDVGPYAIQQNTLALSFNYDLSYVGDSLTITTRPITVTADTKSKIYGETDPALTYQITSGSLAFSDDFSGGLSRVTGQNVSSYAIQQNDLMLSANYDLTYVGDNLITEVRPVDVTAYPQTKTYGDSDPAFTYHITSGSLAFSDAFTGELDRTTGEDVGDYVINQGSLGLSSNYVLTYYGNVLSIGVRPIEVTAYPQIKLYGDSDPAFTYHLSFGSLSFSDAFTGELDRDTGENVGDYDINQGTLGLSSNYDLTCVGNILSIGARPIEATANPQTKAYGDTDPALTYHISSGSLAFSDAFTGDLDRDTGEVIGTYDITQGSLALSSNYGLTFIGDALSIEVRPVEVTAYHLTKAYGDTDPALTYHITSGSLAFSDAFTGDLERDTGENVGDYSINQGTLGLSSNYELTYIGDVLAITPRAITVTADAKFKFSSQTDPVLTYQITSGSLVAGDDFTGSIVRDPGEDFGAYAITQGSLALSTNYELTFIGANLTITPWLQVFLPIIYRP
jgi:hypothetical protein